MHEYGIVLPTGVPKFCQAVVENLESEKGKLTVLSQEMFWKLVEEFVALEHASGSGRPRARQCTACPHAPLALAAAATCGPSDLTEECTTSIKTGQEP